MLQRLVNAEVGPYHPYSVAPAKELVAAGYRAMGDHAMQTGIGLTGYVASWAPLMNDLHRPSLTLPITLWQERMLGKGAANASSSPMSRLGRLISRHHEQ